MPDRFSNPNLTEQDFTAIQNSTEDTETIARHYKLNASEVKAIRASLNHITSQFTMPSMEAAPATAAPTTAPDPKASPY